MHAIQTIQELGSFSNKFGLLSADMKRVRPQQFVDFLGKGSTKTEVAKILKIPRTSLYQDEIKISPEFVKERLIPIAASADMAFEIFNDLEKARLWIITPNSYFFGQSPFDMCLIGKGEAVMLFLSERLQELRTAKSQNSPVS